MLTPEIVELEAITVVGMSSLINSQCNLIPKLWIRFMPRGQEIEHISMQKVAFGVSFGMEMLSAEGEPPKYEFMHLVGYPVDSTEDIPEGMSYKQISAHKCAKFTHKGPISTLSKTYDDIFMQWLPMSGEEYDPSIGDLEWYDERFKHEEEDSEFDIYVPIK
ncbi:MAG: GyrI-like domain-containing protein [bacterium]|nr:GyrI-like domain-containing protein [bacterium]